MSCLTLLQYSHRNKILICSPACRPHNLITYQRFDTHRVVDDEMAHRAGKQAIELFNCTVDVPSQAGTIFLVVVNVASHSYVTQVAFHESRVTERLIVVKGDEWCFRKTIMKLWSN